jgi:hypothetical protein
MAHALKLYVWLSPLLRSWLGHECDNLLLQHPRLANRSRAPPLARLAAYSAIAFAGLSAVFFGVRWLRRSLR